MINQHTSSSNKSVKCSKELQDLHNKAPARFSLMSIKKCNEEAMGVVQG